jgi:hypothetical protein
MIGKTAATIVHVPGNVITSRRPPSRWPERGNRRIVTVEDLHEAIAMTKAATAQG